MAQINQKLTSGSSIFPPQVDQLALYFDENKNVKYQDSSGDIYPISHVTASIALTGSYVEINNIDGYSEFSSSVETRVTDLENFSSSLDLTYATDAQLNASSSTLQGNIDTLDTKFVNYTSSTDIRLVDLENFSSSLDLTYATDAQLNASSSTLQSNIDTLDTKFVNYTSSTDIRLVDLENFSSSLDLTYATDAQLNASSSTLQGNIDNLDSRFVNYTSSTDLRLDSLETESGSIRSDFDNFSGSINTTIKNKLNTDNVVSSSIQISHDNTSGFVSDEHINHSTVDIVAGNGLTGGGDITTSRTLNVASANNGIVVNADNIELDTNSSTFTTGVKNKLNTDNIISSSIQVDVRNTTGIATIATTGSNTFTGTQNFTNTTNSTFWNNGALKIDGGVGIAKDVNISGSLTVDGLLTVVSMSTQYVTSSEYTIGVSKIILNDDDLVRFAGLSVRDSGSTDYTGSFFWDSLENRFIIEAECNTTQSSGIVVMGPKHTGSMGGESNFTPYRVPVASCFTHIDTDPSISPLRIESSDLHVEDGLVVTGSINAGTFVGMVSQSVQIDHDSTTNYVANEHIDHSTIAVIAGNGLTGGGHITASSTLNIGAGTGIDVGADSISVDVSDFMSNGANNRVLTAAGTDTINAEANLTFDGSTLTVNGNTVLSGSLGIAGNTTQTGNVNQTGNTALSGSVTHFGNRNSIGNVTQSGNFDISGNIHQSGSITQTGSISTQGLGIDLQDDTEFIVSGSELTFDFDTFDMSGSLIVTGSSDIVGDLTVSNNLSVLNDATITNNLVVGGTITAEEFYTEVVSSSIIYESGSTKFGDSSDDTHQFTGSVSITGSASIENTLNVIGSVTASAGITGSLIGLATNAVSSSYALTSSYAANAELFDGHDSPRFATTGSNNFNGNQVISGSLIVSGSQTITGSISIDTTDSSPNIFGDSITDEHIFSGSIDVLGGSLTLNTSDSSPNIFGDSLTDEHYFTGSVNVTGSVEINGTLHTSATLSSLAGPSSSVVVTSIPTGSYDTAHFDYVLKDGTNYRAGTVMSVWNNSGSVEYTDTSTNDIGNTSTELLIVSASNGNIQLLTTVGSGSWTVKTSIRMF